MSAIYFEMHKKCKMEEFPGDPVARTQHFYCNDAGSIPSQGTKIPQATQCGKKKKKVRWLRVVSKDKDVVNRIVKCSLWFPRWLHGKESTCQCRRQRRLGFSPWVRKIPWRRHSTIPLFLPGESHEQRSLAGYSP